MNENDRSERTFTFAIHDLLELIETGEIDGSLVIRTLKSRLRKYDRALDIADAVVSSKITEERYFNAQKRI